MRGSTAGIRGAHRVVAAWEHPFPHAAGPTHGGVTVQAATLFSLAAYCSGGIDLYVAGGRIDGGVATAERPRQTTWRRHRSPYPEDPSEPLIHLPASKHEPFVRTTAAAVNRTMARAA
ncbi:hypothetical protein J2W20_003654 [Sinomonas atrocyanea]|jgi:hypothetical protein|nr:hypothetical protein [Sinomonas atrocyanea]MDR6623425.1 hypothetical protein [Sinomonas atrocyanea]